MIPRRLQPPSLLQSPTYLKPLKGCLKKCNPSTCLDHLQSRTKHPMNKNRLTLSNQSQNLRYLKFLKGHPTLTRLHRLQRPLKHLMKPIHLQLSNPQTLRDLQLLKRRLKKRKVSICQYHLQSHTKHAMNKNRIKLPNQTQNLRYLEFLRGHPKPRDLSTQ